MRKRLATVLPILTAGVLLALPATSHATPTGALVMAPASTSTVYAEVVSGEQLELANIDPTAAHTLTSSIGGATVAPLKTGVVQVTAAVGTVAFGTIDGTTPVVITVV